VIVAKMGAERSVARTDAIRDSNLRLLFVLNHVTTDRTDGEREEKNDVATLHLAERKCSWIATRA